MFYTMLYARHLSKDRMHQKLFKLVSYVPHRHDHAILSPPPGYCYPIKKRKRKRKKK